MTRLSLILFLLVSILGINAHAGSSSHWILEDQIEVSRAIPLKRSGNLFFIESIVNNQNGNFILDTGAEGLVVNQTYFRDYKIDRTSEVGTINSESDFVKYIKVDGLVLGDIQFKGRTADVVDLSQIENNRGFKVFGLIGLSFFRDYIVEVDMKSSALILHDRDYIIEEEAYIDVPTKSYNGVPSISLSVNGEKLRFILDTGAEMNVIHNALDPKVYDGMEIMRTTELFGADGRKTQVLVAKLKSIVVDEHELTDALTLVLNMQSTRSVVNADIAGTLGFPFFSEGRVLFDIRKKRLRMYGPESRDE
ncbi:MAG: hypothetical protein HKN45_01795 [Flavobacteriales bacterium]|nr:hypothetical protein [Flavobacteriales bacterium]